MRHRPITPTSATRAPVAPAPETYANLVEERTAKYLQCFSTPAGRVVLDDLERQYGRRPSFVAGDALSTMFREGQRDVFLSITTLVERGERREETGQ